MGDLSKRAVACKGWRWMAGMLTTDGWRLALLQSDGKWLAVNERTSSVSARVDLTGALPDLTDPATLGCLLHLVREAWDEHLITLTIEPYGPADLAIRSPDHGERLFDRPSIASALVAALEAAP